MMDILVVGNCCHDTLLLPHGEYEALGGSTSYISAALGAAGVDYRVIGKVGEDFLYADQLPYKPIVTSARPTTRFVDDLRPQGERICILKSVCDPIRPEDLPREKAKIGIACGVAMELLPETLVAMRERVEILICDAQGLLRQADIEGRVQLRKLSLTDFHAVYDRIDYLKASVTEARYLDLPLGPVKLVVTEGPKGAILRERGDEVVIPSVPTEEVDATGAGDSFVAGLSLGLLSGLSPVEAIRQGNRYGALAVTAVGVPDFTKLFAERAAGSPALSPESTRI
ncbi:MAG TPA: PfkB family carbohydrate kinase [Bdellovibrionota bacterium]|nr:PfkB family carbohydrate kinase [Bdellovibrionota bacterium]